MHTELDSLYLGVEAQEKREKSALGLAVLGNLDPLHEGSSTESFTLQSAWDCKQRVRRYAHFGHRLV